MSTADRWGRTALDEAQGAARGHTALLSEFEARAAVEGKVRAEASPSTATFAVSRVPYVRSDSMLTASTAQP